MTRSIIRTAAARSGAVRGVRAWRSQTPSIMAPAAAATETEPGGRGAPAGLSGITVGRSADLIALNGGKLHVETTNLTAGFLRKNGVPYSADTTVTEYYNLLREPDGTEWFVVTTRIHDPENLVVDYIHSTNFRREPDNSSWNPTPCTLQ